MLDLAALAIGLHSLVLGTAMLLFPVTHAVHVVVRATLHVFGVEMSDHLNPERTEEELRGAIDLHAGHLRRPDEHPGQRRAPL